MALWIDNRQIEEKCQNFEENPSKTLLHEKIDVFMRKIAAPCHSASAKNRSFLWGKRVVFSGAVYSHQQLSLFR